MKSVLYLVKNNIRFKTGAFRSVIILMAIIVFSYSCSVSNSKNLNTALSQSLDHYGVGDLVMTYKGSEIPTKVIDGLAANENVSSCRSDDMLFVAMDCYGDGKELEFETRLIKQKKELKVFKENSDGFENEPPLLSEGQVYVSFCFGKMYGLERGSKLEIQTSPNTRESFEIKGFVEDPIYGTSLVAYENFYINENDWDRIAEGIKEGSVNNNYIYPTKMLHIFKSGDIKDFELVKQLNDQCGLVDESMLYVTRSELVSYTEIYADVGTSLLYAFVGLLAVVVGLMMLNSINSTVEMQYVDLGILKSQGFTVWQIRLSYIVQYVFALICGTVIGLLVSVPMLSVMGKLFMTVTGIWTDCSIDFLSNSIIAIAMIAVFVLFILFSTRKLKKISPVNALNNAHKDVHFTGRLSMPMKQRSLPVSMSMRALTSGLRHYIFVFLITVLLMFFMVTIFNLTNGINFEEMFGYNWSNVSAKLFNEFEQSDMELVRDKIKQIDPKAEADFVAYTDNILADDVLYGSTATDNLERYYKPIKGKLAEYDNEVIITKIVADELEKGIGDSITVSNSGNKADYTIVGIVQTTAQSGRLFCTTLDGAKRIGIKPYLTNIYLDDKSKDEEVVKALNEQMGDRLFAKAANKTSIYETTEDLVNMFLVLIVVIVVGVSAIFLLVAVSLICKVTFLRERTDIGIFKATGFTTGNLRAQFSVRFLMIGVLGCIVGTVIAVFATNPLLSMLMKIVGMTDFMHSLTVFEVIIPAAVICLCFAGFSYMSSRRIRTVQTTELICE
ncbi:FtsX-like permease family protein [Ruminococcus sp. FC2018]|uniref:ABC transporter permease n=1 Tax=Ruminococcus sp. FC2018 TaxID=1410617 RepID=UPI00048FA834|nr:FtsX-like permease family protein [Ruminococcus sp. FC2018]